MALIIVALSLELANVKFEMMENPVSDSKGLLQNE